MPAPQQPPGSSCCLSLLAGGFRLTTIIDGQVQELNNRFDEVNIELLICMASFSPTNSFAAFNAENMIKLAKLYPRDFEFEEMNQLPFQLN